MAAEGDPAALLTGSALLPFSATMVLGKLVKVGRVWRRACKPEEL